MEEKKANKALFNNQVFSRVPAGSTGTTAQQPRQVVNSGNAHQVATNRVASPSASPKAPRSVTAPKPAQPSQPPKSTTSAGADFFNDDVLTDDIINALAPNTVKKQGEPEETNKPTKKAPKPKKDSKKNKNIFLILGALILIVVIVVVVIILNSNKTDNAATEASDVEVVEGEPSQPETTEEEDKITKETLDKYTEVTVEGYKEADETPSGNPAVLVTVKNTSEEATSLAIVIAALDSDENVLDTSSLYAEGIAPGQVQTFELFSFSELKPDQLKSAKYKVFKASTYETPESNGEDIVEESTGEPATEAEE